MATSPRDPVPAWVDRVGYPFASRSVALPSGRVHYVDEGTGEAVLFVHGTPTWSYEWVVWGLRDPAFRPHFLARWAQLFGPEARVVRLPAAGHWPHEEAPEAVRQELLAFLEAS